MNTLDFNSRYEKQTNSDITHIINTYAAIARTTSVGIIPKRISSIALAFTGLQAGMNMVYIRYTWACFNPNN